MRTIMISLLFSAVTFAQIDAGKAQPLPIGPEAKIVWSLDGFSSPAAAVFDGDSDTYLVSNVNGSPFDKDNNGFISEVSAEGKLLSLKFIEGGEKKVTLNAPRGMLLIKGVLYVADLDMVRWFDRKTGAPLGSITVLGSSLVKDLALGNDGRIYLTDSGVKGAATGPMPTGTDGLYSLELSAKPKLRTVRKSKDLHGPGGIIATLKGLAVVTSGSDELMMLDEKGRDLAPVIHVGAKSLEGIVRVGSDFIISSPGAKALLLGPATGPFTQLIGDLESPGDLAINSKRNRVMVPSLLKNRVDVVQLP